MHLLGLVVLDPLGHVARVKYLRVGLQSFLQLGNAPFNRLKHLLCLAACVTEHNDPLVLAQLLPQSFGVGLQDLVALLQAASSVIELLACAREDALGPRLEHGEPHGQEIQRCPKWLHTREQGHQARVAGVILRCLDNRRTGCYSEHAQPVSSRGPAFGR